MPNIKNRFGSYRIEEKRISRYGHLFYIEQGGRLPFFWDILGTPGIGIEIPLPEEWDAFCEKHGAEWAKNRREEILQRVSQWVLKKWFGKGEIEYTEHWINIRPGPSLLSRLLSRIGF